MTLYLDAVIRRGSFDAGHSMRQTVLILLLVFVIVLSAHYAVQTRTNQLAEQNLRDIPLDLAGVDEMNFDEVEPAIADAAH